MSLFEEKNSLRRKMRERLKDWFSDPESALKTDREVEKVRKRLRQVPEFLSARTVMIYLNLPREFPTFPLLGDFLFVPDGESPSPELPSTRRLVVPYCDGDDLRLFLLAGGTANQAPPVSPHLDSSSVQSDGGPAWLSLIKKRLETGAFGIPEPSKSVRSDPRFQVSPHEIDFVLLPGLAFDERGGRLGKGKGFYDRFLSQLPSKTTLAALSFDWQIVDSVPMEPHDRRVDYLITPDRVTKIGSSPES